MCWHELLECAKGTKEHWDKLIFKEGCELVFKTGKSSWNRIENPLELGCDPRLTGVAPQRVPALLSFRVMAFLGAVRTADDDSLSLYALLHVPWWMSVACQCHFSLPALASPVHAWGWKLLHGDWCCQFIFAHECCWMTKVLNKPQCVFFACLWDGWGWQGEGWCVWLFFIIIIWSKEAETCLEVFQLPVFLFDLTLLSILCQPSFSSEETGSFAYMYLWSNQLPES